MPTRTARVPGTPHRRFLSSALLIAALSALAGLAMLVREGVTAQYFGRSDAIEAFIIASLVPVFLINAVGNSVGAGFVPTLLAVRHEKGPAAAAELLGAFQWLAIGLVAAAVVLAAIVFPHALPVFARGFDAGKLTLTREIFLWLLPVVFLGAIGKFWIAILNGYEHFVAGSLVPVAVPLAVIVALALAPAHDRLAWLVGGVAVGFALQAVASLVLAARARLLVRPRLVPRAGALLRRVSGQYFALLAGTLTLMLLEVVDATFAALQGAGTVAAVSYASKVAVFILAFVGSAVATAVVPAYARMRSEASGPELLRFLRAGEWSIIGGGVALAAILALASPVVVTLVFQRGQFSAGDAEAVSRLNALYVLSAPAFLIGVYYGRLLLVEGQSRTLLVGALLSVVTAVAGNLTLLRPLGAAAIPVASVLAYLVSAIWLRVRLGAVLAERLATRSAHG